MRGGRPLRAAAAPAALARRGMAAAGSCAPPISGLPASPSPLPAAAVPNQAPSNAWRAARAHQAGALRPRPRAVFRPLPQPPRCSGGPSAPNAPCRQPTAAAGHRAPGCRGGGGDIAAAVRRASSRQLPSSCLGGALHHLHGVDHLLRGLWVQGGVMRAGDKLRGPWQRPRPRGAGACCHCQITGAAHLHAC